MLTSDLMYFENRNSDVNFSDTLRIRLLMLNITICINIGFYQGLLYTGRARASLGLSSLGQFFRQCLSPHFLLWNLDFWYAWSLGQNEKN